MQTCSWLRVAGIEGIYNHIHAIIKGIPDVCGGIGQMIIVWANLKMSGDSALIIETTAKERKMEGVSLFSRSFALSLISIGFPSIFFFRTRHTAPWHFVYCETIWFYKLKVGVYNGSHWFWLLLQLRVGGKSIVYTHYWIRFC